MHTRKIGSLDVSIVGVGCNNFGGRIDEAATKAVVDTALDAGINFFDTADIYGGTKSEEFLGRALGPRRKDAVIATKFGMEIAGQPAGASPAYLKKCCEDSLRRLGTDVIDLYQLHQPDPTVPVAETLGALDDLVKEGKVREIGCSNFDAAMLQEAGRVAPGARFVSVQNHYSLLHREPEPEVLAECERQGLGFLPYFPLACGLLTGKYHGGARPEGTRIQEGSRWLALHDTADQLEAFAVSRGHTLLELAFSWLLQKGVVSSVIAGATKPAQIRANAAAVGWTLTPDELAEVDRIAPPSLRIPD